MKTDYIFSADWHLRDTTPEQRKGGFYTLMLQKVEYVFRLVKQENATLIIAGDLGDTSQWSNTLLKDFIFLANRYNINRNNFIVVPGQHDLKYHSLDMWEETGLGVLHEAGIAHVLIDTPFLNSVNDTIICPYPYGESIDNDKYNYYSTINTKRHIAVMHRLIFKKIPSWASKKKKSNIYAAKDILKTFSQYDLIVTGDNHEPFTEDKLINCGSLMRLTTAQKKHKPKIYEYNIDNNSITTCLIPIKSSKNVFMNYSNDIQEQVSEFLNVLELEYDRDLLFEDNIKKAIAHGKIQKQVVKKIYQALEGVL